MGFIKKLFGISNEDQEPTVETKIVGPEVSNLDRKFTFDIPVMEELPKSEVKDSPPPPGPSYPFCPYCGVEVEPPPKRQRRCPHCGETFRVRTWPWTEQRILVTESQVELVERAWTDRNIEQNIRTSSTYIDVTASLWEKVTKQLTEEWGAQPNTRDVFWRAASIQLEKKGASGDWHSMSQIYREMATVQSLIGSDNTLSLQLANQVVAEGLRADGWDELMISAGCCAPCDEDDQVSVSVTTAVDSNRLPHQHCERDQCVCFYRAKVLRG